MIEFWQDFLHSKEAFVGFIAGGLSGVITVAYGGWPTEPSGWALVALQAAIGAFRPDLWMRKVQERAGEPPPPRP